MGLSSNMQLFLTETQPTEARVTSGLVVGQQLLSLSFTIGPIFNAPSLFLAAQPSPFCFLHVTSSLRSVPAMNFKINFPGLP